MKLHVSAYNGHRQVSTPIKKSLYICVAKLFPSSVSLYAAVNSQWTVDCTGLSTSAVHCKPTRQVQWLLLGSIVGRREIYFAT